MGGSPTVPLFGPDGKLYDIPYEGMHDALQNGGKMAVHVQDPTGKDWYIPADQTVAATKAGGKIIPYQVAGEKPTNLNRVLTGEPLTGMEAGLSSPAQTPENQSKMAQGAAAGMLAAPIVGAAIGAPSIAAAGTAAAKALPAVGRTVLGGSAGASVGGYAGKEIGGIFGNPELGQKIGAGIGGVVGGGMGARGIEVPSGKYGLLGRLLGGKSPVYGELDATKLNVPYAGEEIPPELGSPENPGFMSKLPSRLTKSQQEALKPVDLSDLATKVPTKSSPIYGPESPAPPINKTYVSYSAKDLVALAKKGDLNAVRELIRNPRGVDLSSIPGVSYLMEPGRRGVVYGGPSE